MTLLEEMQRGEKILKEIKPSRWAFINWYLIGILTLILVIGVVIILLAIFIRRGTSYYITNKRVIREFTFLSRKISSATYDKIQDLHLTQNVVERAFGIGTIHINTAGTGFVEIKFTGVENPISVKRMVESQIMRKSQK